MSTNAVLQVKPSVLQEMKNYYQGQILAKTPPYANFAAKVGAVTITAYNSGKVVFQGSGAEEAAAKWQDSAQPVAAKKSVTNNESSLPTNFASLSVLGSDEVGNGSYFGPLVVCAVYADKKLLPLLKELGVKDSKALNDTLIRKIAEDLKVSVPYKILVLDPAKYNEIQPKYNAVHMKVALHNQAIALLLAEIAPVMPEAILIDQFTPENNYKKYVANEKNQVTQKIYFSTKGEQEHLAVAAASILCRARFLEELDKATEKAGFTIPSGAGKTADLAAAKILKKGGLALLGQYAKLHFANTQKAQKLANGK